MQLAPALSCTLEDKFLIILKDTYTHVYTYIVFKELVFKYFNEEIGILEKKKTGWNMNASKPIIAIHGGAWAIPDDLSKGSVEGVKQAANLGFRKLKQNGSAIEAVVSALTSLENDPIFDAGM